MTTTIQAEPFINGCSGEEDSLPATTGVYVKDPQPKETRQDGEVKAEEETP